jgi:hypothetical protein
MGVEVIVTTAIGITALTLSTMLIPAAVELSSPKDAGPRFITDCTRAIHVLSLANLEEETLYAQYNGIFGGLLSKIPDLEPSI